MTDNHSCRQPSLAERASVPPCLRGWFSVTFYNVTVTQSTELLSSTSRRWPASVWIAAFIFSLLSISAAATSWGFLEADACTHYISASFGFRQPLRLVSVWDRPLFMLLYTPGAALFGVMGARLTSLAMALLCAWSAWRIAARLNFRRPELAVIFTLGQPLLFLHSIAELTELCFAAVIGLAFLCFLDRRWLPMALLLAISPLGRPEGFGFIAVGALALIAYRKWLHVLILPTGLLAWTIAGWILWGRPDYGHGPFNPLFWLPDQWPYSGTSMYEAGPLLFWKTQQTGDVATSFLMKLPMLIGPLLFPFLLVGTFLMLRSWRTDALTYLGRAKLASILLPWLILAGHSFLWWRGLMASNGELRYLLVTAPLWAVIGAYGFEHLILPIRSRIGAMALAGCLALLPAVANLRYHVVPLPFYDDDKLARQVAQWYAADQDLQRNYPRLTASYIAVYLYLEYSPTDWSRTVLWGKDMVKEAPPGVVLIWDEINGTKNADANMCITREELETHGWRQIERFTEGEREWFAFISPNPAKVAGSLRLPQPTPTNDE